MQKYISLLAVCLLGGCATQPDMIVNSQPGQKGEVHSYFSAAESNNGATVIVTVDQFINAKYDHPALKLHVANLSDSAQMLALKNVKVFADGIEVPVVNPISQHKSRAQRYNNLARTASGRGTRSVYRGPVLGHSDVLPAKSNIYTAAGHISAKYGHFINNQLVDVLLEPTHAVGGYISFEVDKPDGVKQYLVVVEINHKTHTFHINRV